MAPPEIPSPEEQRHAEVSAAVAVRLKHVCAEMDSHDFELLVAQIVHFKIKWGESLVYDNPPALGAWMFDRDQADNKK